MNEYVYDDEHPFLEKLKELVSSGVSPRLIRTFTPTPVHGVSELLREQPTFVRVFAVLGALAGTFTGAGLTIYTSLRYPLIVGGKPYVALLPYFIIMFELTILFGAISTFIGFLLLARLPSVPRILEPHDYGNKYAIVVWGEGAKFSTPEEQHHVEVTVSDL